MKKMCSGLAGIVLERRWGQTLVMSNLWPLTGHGQGPGDEMLCHV